MARSRDASTLFFALLASSAAGEDVGRGPGGTCYREDAAREDGSWDLAGCTALDLSCNTETRAGHTGVLGRHLVGVPLCANALRPGQMTNLSKALGDEGGADLKSLAFRGSGAPVVGLEGALLLAAALSGHGALESLDLGSCKIGDEGLRALSLELVRKPAIRLRSLNLQHNDLSDDGLRHLTRELVKPAAPMLATLDISWNGILQRGGRYLGDLLRENPHLLELHLSWNNIGDRGAKHVADALATNRALVFLDLEFNGIHHDGAMDLATALRRNGALKTLRIDNNAFDRKDWAKVNASLAAVPGAPEPSVPEPADSEYAGPIYSLAARHTFDLARRARCCRPVCGEDGEEIDWDKDEFDSPQEQADYMEILRLQELSRIEAAEDRELAKKGLPTKAQEARAAAAAEADRIEALWAAQEEADEAAAKAAQTEEEREASGRLIRKRDVQAAVAAETLRAQLAEQRPAPAEPEETETLLDD